MTMDQERPRSDLSINSRNNLRKLLHLEFLYKENKVCAFKVWRDVLELSLATSKRSRALPSHQRQGAGGGPRLRSPSRRNRSSPVPTNPECALGSCLRQAMSCAARVARLEPEPVNSYSLCSLLPHEAIFSQTVLKNILFSYTEIFHSLPA